MTPQDMTSPTPSRRSPVATVARISTVGLGLAALAAIVLALRRDGFGVILALCILAWIAAATLSLSLCALAARSDHDFPHEASAPCKHPNKESSTNVL